MIPTLSIFRDRRWSPRDGTTTRDRPVLLLGPPRRWGTVRQEVGADDVGDGGWRGSGRVDVPSKCRCLAQSRREPVVSTPEPARVLGDRRRCPLGITADALERYLEGHSQECVGHRGLTGHGSEEGPDVIAGYACRDERSVSHDDLDA